MQSDQILSQIDPEAVARDTLAFLQVRSETGTEGAGSHFLADLMRRVGFAVEVDEFLPGRPNVYARLQGGQPGLGRSLLFNGHTDTIPVGRSLPPARDGDWLVGRGSEDMKGGLVAMVYGAAALAQAGVELAGDLWLTGVVGHEMPVGQKEGPRRLIELMLGGRIPAQAIVIVEGPCAIWSASLGSTIFHITITSPLGPIHTIKTRFAENPAYWAGRLLTELQELELQYEAQPHHPLCGRDQVNVGIVQGGDWFNRLPSQVRITGTRRWRPGRRLAEVEAELRALCARLAAESGLAVALDLERAASREPFETPAAHPLVQALYAAGQQVSGRPPQRIGMGLVGDANLYANDGGVPTVYYGPAHETAHSDVERVSLAQLVHCARVYALAALHYCRPAEG